ncbi:hypothetical protein ABZ753_34235 [Streptomyces griseoincarnatus]
MLTDLWPLSWSIGVFLLAMAVTVVCSIRLAGVGDTLADRTGWGEALFGAGPRRVPGSSRSGVLISVVGPGSR